jgi:methylthioribose-1-phosphate isomerase
VCRHREYLLAVSTPTHVAWSPAGGVRVLDQTLLPQEERFVDLDTLAQAAEAIRTLRVRGAPLIGVVAAMAVAGEARRQGRGHSAATLAAVREACGLLGATRPTAVNLHWALARMLRRAETAAAAGGDLGAVLRAEAQAIWDEDRAMCDRIGEHGLGLIPSGGTVCTICNAGALATGGIGTALAPLYLAHERGRPVHVLVPETRPLLQGSRLTAWELGRAGIPATLIGDSMIASRFRRGDVAAAFVGADRIARNGDFANKIGTYALALAARAHGVPLYVLAPTSTIDPATPDGASIPIEERGADEVAGYRGQRAAPAGVGVWNPAFDMTPAELVTGIVTDRGIVPPAELARVMD